MSELQLDTLLEATLFGAGRSMSVTELCDSLGYGSWYTPGGTREVLHDCKPIRFIFVDAQVLREVSCP